jgi:hypothetical protein
MLEASAEEKLESGISESSEDIAKNTAAVVYAAGADTVGNACELTESILT